MSKRVSYKLGVFLAVFAVLVSPIVASAATQSGNTTVNAVVSSTITLTTNPTVTINLQPTSSAVLTSVSDTVQVSTNSANGYYLTLADGDTTTNLVNGSDTLAAHAGTFASPTALATNTWGYRIVGQGGFTSTAYSAETNATSSSSTWAGIASSASPQTVKTTSTTASNDPTVVWYAVKIDTSKPTGTYTDTVTYTATTNS
jgi:hypothetical protein